MAGLKLSDYALIGNSRSAALISNTGSIEWCCLPEFHSSSIFAALLDREKGGFFSISPADNYLSHQKYLPDTNVAETYFEVNGGKVRLLDAFTVTTEQEKVHVLFPEHEILRVVEGVSGTVRMKCEYVPKTFYGRNTPRLEDRKQLGIQFFRKDHIFTLLSTINLKIKAKAQQYTAACEFSVSAGERVIFSLCYSNQSPTILPELHATGWERMKKTIRFWKDWIGKCSYSGLYGDHVRRSALTLKLLAHAPSGAIIAAPTTSVPEHVGGDRNWDYRYCWLRDASFTVRVLVKLGYKEEAHAYMNWILHATQLTQPKLQVVYSVYGKASLGEQSLPWLTGYKNSRPVRIGNKADRQFQLDLYGEVLDAFYAYAPLVKDFDRATRKFMLGLGETICTLWDQPDNGIWEIRSQTVHHTHSKVMAWVGLTRLIELCKKYDWKVKQVKKYTQVASRIHTEVEKFGYNENIRSYTRVLKGDDIDASLLILSLVGYCDAGSSRMLSTSDCIHKNLSKNNLIYRYRNVDDGIKDGEGSFGVCNFWWIENLAKLGKVGEARELFEQILKHASPCGLWSEEIDPETYEFLGNYPQGFTHIGLINAALSINSAYQKEAKKNEY